jgi:hypothetical protein
VHVNAVLVELDDENATTLHLAGTVTVRLEHRVRVRRRAIVPIRPPIGLLLPRSSLALEKVG